MDRYLLRNWLPPVIGLALVMTLSTMVSAQDLHSGDIGPTFGPVTATCAFEFSLWDATAGGSQIGTVIESELDVRGGLYEAELDFGAEADDTATRFLEVAVGCPAGTAELTTLTRRLFLPASEPADHRRGDGRVVAHGTAAPPKAALGTAFTYQGELQESGAPVTGSGDFQFSLWDAASGGTQIGATVPVNGVAVADGRFTASIDFGAAAFDGDARWLEIAVDYPSGTGSMTTLSPRQSLSAAPYALQTRGIFVDDTGNVGVGTDTPTDPFHVAGSSTFDGGVHIDSGQGIQFPDLSNRIYSDLGDLRLESGDDIAINPADELDIDSGTLVVDSTTNRVGIGTSTPSRELVVIGDGTFSENLIVGGDVYSLGLLPIGYVHFTNDNGSWIGLGENEPRVVFSGPSGEVSIKGAKVKIGPPEADEMLHIENFDASGLAFLKLQTSHPTEWGETGIRWETPQNRWHLRMDDHTYNNIPGGALGLRCNTPGHELMTWTETGMVGIGNTNPSAKLDLVGDLEIDALTSTEGSYIEFRTNAGIEGQINIGGETWFGDEDRPLPHFLPIAFGSIDSSGSVNSGTGNFSVTRSLTGLYYISIDGYDYNNTEFTTVATCVSDCTQIRVNSTVANRMWVTTYDSSGAATDARFHFVTYHSDFATTP